MVNWTHENDEQLEALRGELETAFTAGDLGEALRLSRQVDEIQLQRLA